jgi:RNA polymerase sigma factor (sigma-70 family)
MSRTPTGIGQLLDAVCGQTDAGSDGQLLQRFLADRDEAAFGLLVRRHGPMVLGVCRRILVNATDAEDAFQAVFIVLVRKAASLVGRPGLGDWLHGVARHAALDAKRAAARRRTKEQAMARPEAQTEPVRNGWLALLDEEVSRLPARYRLPIVLCDLEGKTRQQAAAQLGWPEGTVAGRLARAREMLAKRLLRSGQVATGTVLGTLTEGAAQAALPPGLVPATAQAAVLVAAGTTTAQGTLSAGALTLAQGVLQSMFCKKSKIVAVVVLLGVLLAGAGGLTLHLLAADAPATPAPERDQPAKETPFAKGVKGDKKFQETPDQRVLRLDTLVETKDLTERTLKEFLVLVTELLSASGVEAPILVDFEAFREEAADAPNIYDTTVRFPPYPRKMTVAQCLRFALANVPGRKATFVVYRDHIEITTLKYARVESKLQQPILATFANRKLSQALRELSEMTAASIVIDSRVGDKEDRLVSATFLNDVTLAAALRVLTDMADLKVVVLRGGILYVTTPEHAEGLRKDKAVVESALESP